MRITLTPSYYLTDDLGESPRIVHQQTGEDYGPDDILQWYPSWQMQPCRQSVRRAAATFKLNREQSALVARFTGSGRPPKAGTSATGEIHLRVTMERKNSYVRAARASGLGLSEWMTTTCDDRVRRDK